VRALLLALLLLTGLAAPARAEPRALLEAARARAAAEGCEAVPRDSLAGILCQGHLRVGVRGNYPNFGIADGLGPEARRHGFEIELARAIAGEMGVEARLATVTPANRIANLVERRVDLVIATMGHTLQRDGQVRFIRPHYYQSTTVVVGDRRIPARSLEQMAGRTVCVPLGNADTLHLVQNGVRLLIFDSPQQLVDALKREICALAMHDDSFFSTNLADPGFAARFEQKLAVSALPWGMATAPGSDLAAFLDALSAQWHAEGRFLALAGGFPIARGFLERQQELWRSPACRDGQGMPQQQCLGEPSDTTLPPTAFVDRVEGLEAWLREALGISVTLPMLKTQVAFEAFLRGILFSLVLVVGSIFSTLALALMFASALCARPASARIAARMVTGVLQCSPLVLLLFFGYMVASTLVPYSSGVALALAVLMIGLYNGSSAAQAIGEFHATQRRVLPGAWPPLGGAVQGAAVQIMSFLVNATKSSAVASMVGVPELLNELTDITSFTSERIMTYSFLLVFYTLLVSLVVMLMRRLQGAFERRAAA
jgi:ABC-type amino acid transport substrate-binding protein/ABC-type amino acid transport system permease subunit